MGEQRGGTDWWHNPSGWVLLGVLMPYLGQARSLLPFSSLLWNSLILLWLTGGLHILLRHHHFAKSCLIRVHIGILLGAIALWWHQTPLWPEDYPPREYHGPLRITRVFQANSAFSSVSGLATLQSRDQPAWQSLHGTKLYFSLESSAPHLSLYAGQILNVVGVLRPLDPPHLRHGFQDYLSRLDVSCRIAQGTIHPQPPGHMARFREQGKQLLDNALRIQSDHRPREQAACIGMVLGDTRYLSEEDSALYRSSGTLHLFAISGMHIAIIAAGLLMTLQLFRIPKSLQAVLGISLLGLYVWVTGSAPSAVRAWVMITLFWSGYGLSRKPSSWRALTASALVLLLISPDQLNHPGFQLSYSVVAVILLWGIPILQWIPLEKQIGKGYPSSTLSRNQRWTRNVVRILWSTLVISTAASLGSMPWILSYFGIVTAGGILINLPASLTASGVLFSSMVSVAGHLLGIDAISAFFNQTSLLLLALFLHWIEALVTLPGFTWETLEPPIPAISGVLILSGILLLLSGRYRPGILHKFTCVLFPLWILLGLWYSK